MVNVRSRGGRGETKVQQGELGTFFCDLRAFRSYINLAQNRRNFCRLPSIGGWWKSLQWTLNNQSYPNGHMDWRRNGASRGLSLMMSCTKWKSSETRDDYPLKLFATRKQSSGIQWEAISSSCALKEATRRGEEKEEFTPPGKKQEQLKFPPK